MNLDYERGYPVLSTLRAAAETGDLGTYSLGVIYPSME